MPVTRARPLAVALAVALAALALGAARPAAAQLFPFSQGDDPEGVRWRRVAGASPLHLLFGSLAGDYEQAVRRDVSLGGGVTYSGANSFLRSATSGGYDFDVSAKARYYLYGAAPNGASIGVVAGFVNGQRARRADADPSLPARRVQTAPTLGFTADYNRFVGPTRRVVLGTGYGLKRRYSRVSSDYEGISQLQATFRVLFGYAW